ncbi:hypothetical protein [Acaryochloris marina]|nr:hypothetical protein [Acaryochloris marina]QUY42732.1 hypothetical protein I1H34_26845 [Acaryochloris marina S15]
MSDETRNADWDKGLSSKLFLDGLWLRFVMFVESTLRSQSQTQRRE